MHFLNGITLLIFVASSVSRACIPTKTPQPGIPAMPGPATPAHGNMPFTTKEIACNKYKFVCLGSAIEFNDATQVGDAGDGTPDGKVSVELDCSADQTTWQHPGIGDITKIACFQ